MGLLYHLPNSGLSISQCSHAVSSASPRRLYPAVSYSDLPLYLFNIFSFSFPSYPSTNTILVLQYGHPNITGETPIQNDHVLPALLCRDPPSATISISITTLARHLSLLPSSPRSDPLSPISLFFHSPPSPLPFAKATYQPGSFILDHSPSIISITPPSQGASHCLIARFYLEALLTYTPYYKNAMFTRVTVA